MIIVPKVALALASVAWLCVAPAAYAKTKVHSWRMPLAVTNVDRGNRFEPRLLVPGSASLAASKCVGYAIDMVERLGRPRGADIDQIAVRRHGYHIFGNVLFEARKPSVFQQARFSCQITHDHLQSFHLYNRRNYVS
ncbi:MAG: hypothetical protein ACKVOJ_12050 [Sphingomonadaceae bacterium]